MPDQIPVLISILTPALLICYAIVSQLSHKNDRSQPRKNAANIGLIGIVISLLSAVYVFEYGTIQSTLLGIDGLGFSVRLDALSVTIFLMISILSFVILRFSTNYLDGDPRKAIFFSRLTVTMAAVELLVLSGNLFQIWVLWVATSVCLHYLLVFYRYRPQAIAAARKKFIVARLGDTSLVAALVLIYSELGTGELDQIFAAISEGAWNPLLNWAAILLVITALLKSAQFPTYGWLIEVVETPTPVSALLHAGLLNAGPFLMVRLSYLIVESTTSSIILIAVCGFTAVFASVVYLTQPSVKIALGYSSVAHMGFSLLLCGLGIYSAAILHIVAHSFYKAHSFLSSGNAVEANNVGKIILSEGNQKASEILLSMAFSVMLYVSFILLFGLNNPNNYALLVIGGVIVLGVTQIMASTARLASGLRSYGLAAGLGLVVVLAFFTLEHASSLILGGQIPELIEPNSSIKLASLILLTCFLMVMGLQLFSGKFRNHRLGYQLGIHIRNGLYANVIFDRIIGSLKSEKFKWANLAVEEEVPEKHRQNVVLPEKEVFISN